MNHRNNISKMSIPSVIVAILITLASSIKAITINCNFTAFTVDDLIVNQSSNIYGCAIIGFSDINQPQVSIAGYNGSSTDIVGISIKNQNVDHMLNNFGSIFTDVKVISIRNCTVNGISLDGYKNLQALEIIGSDLKFIKSDFFKNNQHMQHIRISDNSKLTEIDVQAFKELKNLKILDFSNNSCTKGLKLNSSDVQEVLNVLKLNCEAKIQILSTNSSELSFKDAVIDQIQSTAENQLSAVPHVALNHPNLTQKIISKESATTPDNSAQGQSGSVKAVVICVMFVAVMAIMCAALLVKKRTSRNYENDLLVDNTYF